MKIEIVNIYKRGSPYIFPEEIKTDELAKAASVQKEDKKTYVYQGYSCRGGDVFIEVPARENRELEPDMLSLWLKFVQPFEYDEKTMTRQLKQILNKSNNPFDIIDYKGIIDILRQLRGTIIREQ